MATREICKACGLESPVGFSVPDDVWSEVVGDPGTVRCIMCFAVEADAKRVVWDDEITFYPVSLVTLERGG